MSGQTIGYVRVSTVEQNEDRQLETMKEYNCTKIFKEKVSGATTKRKELENMLDYVREGDTVIIHDFSRLARNTKDLLEIIEKLEDKKVNLISAKEKLDSTTPTGKLMLTMLGAINEFERTMLLERQKEGVAIAKKKGKYKGRKKKEITPEFKKLYNEWVHRKITAKYFYEKIGVSFKTWQRMIDDFEKSAFK